MTDKDGSFKYSLIRLIDLTKKNEALRIYPNPSHGELTVESNFRGRKLTITITDLSGKTASKYTLANSHIISLDVTALAKGMYTLSIDDGSMIRSQLFVKE
jgi:hypothetical protein